MLTIPKACKQMKLSVVEVYRMIDSGELNSVKVKKRHYIEEKEIKKYLFKKIKEKNVLP